MMPTILPSSGIRPRSASEQDFSWLDNMDLVDAIMAESLSTPSNVQNFQQANIIPDAIPNTDLQDEYSLPMPVITAEDITDFLFDLESFEQPNEIMNESQALSVSRDMFEPIPLVDINNRYAVINQNDQDKNTNFVVPKADFSWMTPNSAENSASNFSDNMHRVSPASQNGEEDSSSSDEEQSHQGGYNPKFRGYQCDQWQERYAELLEFHNQNGHSSVPHTDSANRRLARWVKRQRYQYKLRQEGKPSAMTEERTQALERLGFVWDSHGAAFEDRLRELEEFKELHKHCNVPSNYKANSSLASWVKCQRRQYRLYREGKHSNITQARIDQLERMGFQFNLRVGYHHHRCSGNGWS
ncbi:helicase domain protein [Nitzschia inconspicua]|uniref:Helicase domain protein n=1 Tax=Nitzschia inconspicua TaxID=303405 RepID=A0A9K3LXI1_9STRA|nr:helicase domain protein [Nitzschia inconspicua]